MWQGFAGQLDHAAKPGHAAYAAKQMAMWSAFGDKANTIFDPLLATNPLEE